MVERSFSNDEKEDLKIHVVACSLRYEALRGRIHRIEMAVYCLIGLAIANTDLKLFKSLVSVIG